ncbi:MAG: TIGR02757 family protein [Candidatus Rokubacteria bacterium]|nr:TIGR02757 family protein [Candidatus Rokubacteria bacterium]
MKKPRPAPSPALRESLERLYRDFDYAARVDRDAIRFPMRYPDPRDREVVALLTAALAYGRVDLFGRALDGVLAQMQQPWAFVRDFDPRRDGARFRDFVYRFNRPRDIAAFCVAARDVLARHGTLEKCFVAGDPEPDGAIGPALDRFARAFLEADLRDVFPDGRLSRGYRHLFPLPSAGGPCKRLHLFLRWMVRREPPDFGLWTSLSPARLLIPVDTHVENMSRAIGLTRRRSRNWRMAEEVTARLAAIDPGDPVKYDFALCHKRMSGDCLDRRDPIVCAPCGLRLVCRHWRGARLRGAASAPRPRGAASPPRPGG